MTTSNQFKIIQTYSRQACNSQPVGKCTSKELIALEHEWRLKLKSSGFQDIERWTNKPKRKVKEIKFIKGHIRRSRYNKYEAQLAYGSKCVTPNTRFWQGFELNAKETAEYYRVVGLFAYHAPETLLPKKYRLLLQHYATYGLRSEAIRAVAPNIKPSAVDMYMHRNFPKMLAFVNQLDNESDDSTDTRSTYDSRN